jgi:phosphate transport system permease protein
VGAATVIAFNPSGLDSAFTAMPIQIYDWISKASNDVNDYRPLAAAAILILIALLLAMNGVAIWLRNRYEQKW